MKKYFYITLIIIVITMSSYILIRANKNISPAEFAATGAGATTTPSIDIEAMSTGTIRKSIPTPTQQTQTETTVRATTSVTETVPAPAPNTTLSVDGSSYMAFAPAGSTVIDAMRILASTTGFSFSGKGYPSLGFFVDSINGKKAESGYNWILYVNGKLSGTGASETSLKAGDAIEWRYEVSY